MEETAVKSVIKAAIMDSMSDVGENGGILIRMYLRN